ncbi:hypothetical protein PLICRDRAFT_180370 [Plicaturopsis crispa FD-325 SS-3]|uniref:Protein kinase domain-containing protein n=1 Tax=Plicaturopsis crispa FD-325 SS-3 TaxID=944288 RepID=A0A0C9SKB9_PLICR|nr:hypothetical protein PLICRDRAFT_180370 [Plicaturopsis crispa FD-325 SS-3]
MSSIVAQAESDVLDYYEIHDLNVIATLSRHARERGQRTGVRVYTCAIYATGHEEPKLVGVPAYPGNEDRQLVDAVTDLDVGDWFPFGYRRVTLYDVPSTSLRLFNGMEILVSRNFGDAPPNACMMAVFNRLWRGNILVALRCPEETDDSHRDRFQSQLQDISSTEMRYINLVVAMSARLSLKPSAKVSVPVLSHRATVVSNEGVLTDVFYPDYDEVVARRYVNHVVASKTTTSVVTKSYDVSPICGGTAVNKLLVLMKFTSASAAQRELRILQFVREHNGASSDVLADILGTTTYRGQRGLIFNAYGIDLRGLLHLKTLFPLPADHVKAISRQLLEGLAFLHGIGIVHTAIWPENIVLENDDVSIQARVNDKPIVEFPRQSPANLTF